jgi:hypothetical protein
MLEILFKLIGGHFISDYVFQGDSIALGKNRNIDPARFGVGWYYWLASHAFTHAFFVMFLTNSFPAALFEFITHFMIDFGKCEKWFGLHFDQALHIICKLIIIWWIL